MKPGGIKLRKIDLKGYKSIASQGVTVNFGDITILLGANGSGKSNLVSFFKMLHHITTGGFQVFIGKQGGAEAVLHYGSKHTESIEFALHFGMETGRDDIYGAKLIYGMPDRLLLATETYEIQGRISGKIEREPGTIQYGGQESQITSSSNPQYFVVNTGLRNIRTYQFHDTSETAKIKTHAYIEDSRYLHGDAGNLAAFLYALSKNNENYYNRIVHHIANVMPQFKNFELMPNGANGKNVMLNWRDVQGEPLFGPHQISDGSLRFMALAALLLQPPEMIPGVIVIDEPELGLHPAAIAELAGMIKTASKHAQVIVATQSTRLVDEFSAEEIAVVERDEQAHASAFKRLDVNNLGEWLERYSLSELWEKNIIGGQP